jgi:hypothetical protein
MKKKFPAFLTKKSKQQSQKRLQEAMASLSDRDFVRDPKKTGPLTLARLRFRFAGSSVEDTQRVHLLGMSVSETEATMYMVKDFYVGSPVEILVKWLDMSRTGRVTVDRATSNVFVRVGSTTPDTPISEIQYESGFYVVHSLDDEGNTIVYLFDDHFMPITDEQKKLVFMHNVPFQTKKFTFGPQLKARILAMPGLKKVRADLFDMF